ncbi:hypothetical protein [Clostridium phage Saumur]|nr:hypothetical protein [Clostridium phage Saumur]
MGKRDRTRLRGHIGKALPGHETAWRYNKAVRGRDTAR